MSPQVCSRSESVVIQEQSSYDPMLSPVGPCIPLLRSRGAKFKPTARSARSTMFSDRELGSSCECRVPKLGHRRIASAQFARLKLPLLDLLCELDSRDRYDRIVESLES